jgi:hypothetical protein
LVQDVWSGQRHAGLLGDQSGKQRAATAATLILRYAESEQTGLSERSQEVGAGRCGVSGEHCTRNIGDRGCDLIVNLVIKRQRGTHRGNPNARSATIVR